MKKTIDLHGTFLDIYSEDTAGEFADSIYNDNNTNVIVRLNENIFDAIKDKSDVDTTLAKADLILCSHSDLGEENKGENSFYSRILNLCKNDSIIIIGHDDEVIQKLRLYLSENYPEIHIKAEKICDQRDAIESMVNMINDLVPKAVLVLLPSPLQEELICEHKYHMNTGFCIGFGERPEFLGYTKGVLASIFKSKKHEVFNLISDLEIG